MKLMMRVDAGVVVVGGEVVLELLPIVRLVGGVVVGLVGGVASGHTHIVV